MDPPTETSTGYHRSSTSSDPPEERKKPEPPASPSSFSRFGNVHRNIEDDDQLDEFEMEGLIMTPLSSSINSTRTSAIGAGRSKASAAKDYLNFVSAPVMAACSLAWNPRNRARSSIALLFTAFLLMIVFTENDISAWHRTHFTDSDEKEHNSNEGSVEMYDPLAKLTPDQKHTLLTSIYGSWGFYDGSADERPEEPYMTPEFTGNIYLDLTEDKFPPESWQVDAVYVNHFLDGKVGCCFRLLSFRLLSIHLLQLITNIHRTQQLL